MTDTIANIDVMDKQFLAEEEKKRQELKGVVLTDFEMKATLGNAPTDRESSSQSSQSRRQLVMCNCSENICLRPCAGHSIIFHFLEHFADKICRG